jgi:FlaA1/EpsC-like NDP-sugar epimerase
VRSRAPLRFSPSPWQLLALDAIGGVLAFTVAMWLRFVDEGVPATYAQRLLPWLVLAALFQVATGELLKRLRKPGSLLALRPVAPFVLAGVVEVAIVFAFNELLGEPLHLPRSVALIGPLLAAVGSAALRLAAARSVEPEELLPRAIVRLDLERCASVMSGKRLLITGAAGSIGSELARQVLAVGPVSIVAVDMNETGLFELEGELLARRGDTRVTTCMGDVTDARRMRELFEREQPHVVFHAAAYKHVPLLEANPDQGFLSNVLGTLCVCEAAVAAGVGRVVVISTDKAVNPSSFMGLTKRVAELIAASVAQRSPAGPTISVVRFGNVLGSRGSVVPTMLRQIDAGGPITLTHPEMRRFFMTLSEAASLVLLSSALEEPGGAFVLDMGDEVLIADLAQRLVRLKGLRLGRDIGIAHIGLRPGEKLREELFSEDERLVPTEHHSVRRVEPRYELDGAALLAGVQQLEADRRASLLAAEDYAPRLRALIDGAVRPALSSV